MSTVERDHSHRHKRTGVVFDTLAVIAALAAVFGFAALAIAWGFGPVEVAAVVVAVTTAAERLVRLVKAQRTRSGRSALAGKQWGPPAATEGPRPQIAEPSRRSDRELNGPHDAPPSGPRDRYVTECGDVTSLLSSHPRSDGVNEDEVTPVTSTDTVGAGWPVGGRRRRADGTGSAARSDRPRSSY